MTRIEELEAENRKLKQQLTNKGARDKAETLSKAILTITSQANVKLGQAPHAVDQVNSILTDLRTKLKAQATEIATLPDDERRRLESLHNAAMKWVERVTAEQHQRRIAQASAASIEV